MAKRPTSIDRALSFAEHFFQENLHERKVGQTAVQYLRSRGYGKEEAKEYGLGWAPDSWDALLYAAKDQGFPPETLEKAGLVKARETSGYYDRFRARLIFPLYDVNRTPVGFAGRLVSSDDDAPKYINSPTTDRYDKDRYLYGLWRAKKGIKATRTVLITEGYTDVITPQAEGLLNVVASSGTAVTRSQLQRLYQWATRVVFVYDSDEAGIRSSIRGMKRAIAEGLIPTACILPDGFDPHDLIRDRGTEAIRWWAENRYIGLSEFLLRAVEEIGYDPDPSVVEEVVSAAEGAPSEALRQSVLMDAAKSLDVSDQELFARGSHPETLGLES